MLKWQLQEAKAKLSELVSLVQTAGPREITVHGEVKAMIMPIEEFDRRIGRKDPLLELLRPARLAGVERDMHRDPDADLRGSEF